MAGLATAEDEMSLYLNDFNRLYLSLIQWMRLVSYLMEINIHQVYATYIAVPRSSIIEFHGLEV